VFDDRFLAKLKSVGEDQKYLTGAGKEQRFNPESPTPRLYAEKLIVAQSQQHGHNHSVIISPQKSSVAPFVRINFAVFYVCI
jgi:hypothetical protein